MNGKKTLLSSLLVLAAGAAGILARTALYRFGTDESGLLLRDHPLELLCWGIALTVALVLRLTASRSRLHLPGAHFLQLPVSLAAAAGICASLARVTDLSLPLHGIRLGLGLLCAAALVLDGSLRCRKKSSRAWFLGSFCLYGCVELLCGYQVWSGRPQLADYVWQLFAWVAMICGAYQRCASWVGLGSERLHSFSCLMAAFLCLVAAPGTGRWALFLGLCLYFLAEPLLTPWKGEETP